MEKISWLRVKPKMYQTVLEACISSTIFAFSKARAQQYFSHATLLFFVCA